MPDLIAFLFACAVNLSGLPPAKEIPTVVQLPKQELDLRVCGEAPRNCRNLVAVFDTDTKQVWIDKSLDLNNDTDNSFLVHEFVHALQYDRFGEKTFETCQAALASEQQAYATQNAYLKQRGQMYRAGIGLRFMKCD